MSDSPKFLERQNFSQLTQWLSAILLILAEAIWVSLWYRTLLINDEIASPGTELVLAGLMLAAYTLALLVQAGRLVRPVGLVILGSGLLLCLALATGFLLAGREIGFLAAFIDLSPYLVITLVFEVWMIWRGVSMARDVIQPSLAWKRFLLGLVMILANMFIINRFAPGQADWGVFEAYLFAGLSAILLTRISYAGVVHGLKKNPFNRSWLVITLVFVGFVLLLVSSVAAAFTGQFPVLLGILVGTVQWIGRIILFIILLPGALLSYIFLYIIQPLGPWLQKLFDFKLLQQQAARLEIVPPDINQGASLLSGYWQDLIRGVIFWGIILVLLALIFNYFLSRKPRRARVIELEMESENLLEQGDMKVMILKAMRDAFQGLPGRFRPPEGLSRIAEIRRIYARLLALGSELGIPRRPSQTPTEYLNDLENTFVNQQAELQLITTAYVDLRYGEEPETEELVQQAVKAWETIASEGKRLKTIRQALAASESRTSPPV